MSKKMLIDAAQAEEVRVCVTENGKVEDFDFESSSRKPLRGNIYLARVTRVEPSLQAAFVEYGGNRHGFLAFSEIHPDYYQIPVSDRLLLQEAEAEEAALAAELDMAHRSDDDEDDLDHPEASADGDDDNASDDLDEADQPTQEVIDDGDVQRDGDSRDHDIEIDAVSADDDAEEDEDRNVEAPAVALAASPFPTISALEDETDEDGDDDVVDEEPSFDDDANNADDGSYEDDVHAADDAEDSESDDEDHDLEEDDEEDLETKKSKRAHRAELLERYKEARRKRARLIRNYKIQEVVKRRQILLVQVVKEERGNKGAALTTYMSLAGRYCVLMPNTARGGGISRKIPSASDRKRLRRVVDNLDVAQGMGLIIRTAGAKRTKTEIKRDYDYLTRLWETIRTLTLESIAPCLIYEEASLIKRAIRDLYDKDISSVLVEGEDGYREAKDFMKMLMPSHAKYVQPSKDKLALFVRYDVEKQLDAMYQPIVRLKSGGYIVINQTEALIAIDVNSGKATRERNIELTALKTNVEAAAETARQCRLRDLAGLLVIDFIDMEENKNNRTVEKKLKDALKHDRARIQVGRISNFGLLEMSRQRRRSGIVDGTTNACPTCNGAGAVRSSEMAALRILRAIESDAISGRAGVISVRASLEVTLYVLNHKRAWLKRIEDDYALTVEIIADQEKAGDQYDIEKRGAPRPQTKDQDVVRADMINDVSSDLDASPDNDAPEDNLRADGEDDDKPAKRRRRRRRKKRSENDGDREADSDRKEADAASEDDKTPDDSDNDQEKTAREDAEDDEKGDRKKRRRRGRRGGRRKTRREDETAPSSDADATEQAAQNDDEADADRTAPLDDGGAKVSEDTTNSDGEAALDQTAAAANSDGGIPETDPSEGAEANESAEKLANNPGDQTDDQESAPNGSTEPKAVNSGEPSAPTPDEIAERLKTRKRTKKGWWSRALGG